MLRPSILWSLVAVAYAVFFSWYTGCSGPLSETEIDAYLQRLEAQAGEERDPERLAALREFLRADDGGDFIMLNAILMREHPLQVGGVEPGESSGRVLDRYMAFLWPELLSRACHPVIAGTASITAEAWGVEGAERWSMAGLMRYRSRRDLMEIATNPAFDGAHQYKIAAIARTIAFPVDPFLNLGEPRLLVGLLLFSLAAALHLVWGRAGRRAGP